jgi:hypothetical protein
VDLRELSLPDLQYVSRQTLDEASFPGGTRGFVPERLDHREAY